MVHENFQIFFGKDFTGRIFYLYFFNQEETDKLKFTTWFEKAFGINCAHNIVII